MPPQLPSTWTWGTCPGVCCFKREWADFMDFLTLFGSLCSDVAARPWDMAALRPAETSVHWPACTTPGQLDAAHRETSVESHVGCTPRGAAWACAGSALIRASSPLTSVGFVLDGLLEECDVPEGAEEQNHLLVFIPNRSDLHVKPNGCSCRTQLRWQNPLLTKIFCYYITQKPYRWHLLFLV